MPVMVMYRDKIIDDKVCADVAEAIAQLSDKLLNAKIELRVLDTTYAYNSNKLHLEMRFRDFNEWSDSQLEDYHQQVMDILGDTLKAHSVKCGYSFYIIPSIPPRSIWSQDES
jgi:methionine synthase II (cobalamin-independent)